MIKFISVLANAEAERLCLTEKKKREEKKNSTELNRMNVILE